MSALLLLTSALQPSAEVLPGLALLSHTVKILPSQGSALLDAPEAQRLLSQAAREAVDDLITGGDETVRRVTAAYRAYRIRDITLPGLRTPLTR